MMMMFITIFAGCAGVRPGLHGQDVIAVDFAHAQRALPSCLSPCLQAQVDELCVGCRVTPQVHHVQCAPPQQPLGARTAADYTFRTKLHITRSEQDPFVRPVSFLHKLAKELL